jgi:hypothetical protein
MSNGETDMKPEHPTSDDDLSYLKINYHIALSNAEPLLGPVDLTGFAYKIDWIVAGGESGTVARPMNPKWVRELRDQSAAYGLPFLFKQWGNWSPMEDDVPEGFDPLEHQEHLFFNRTAAPVEWPECVWHVGKKIAGRKLDGKIHDEFPEVRHDR